MHMAQSHELRAQATPASPHKSPRRRQQPTRGSASEEAARSPDANEQLQRLKEQHERELVSERAAQRTAELQRRDASRELKQRHEKELAELKKLRAREFAEAQTRQRAVELVEQRLQDASDLDDEVAAVSCAIKRLEMQREVERNSVDALEKELIARRAAVGTLTHEIHSLTKTLHGKQRRVALLYPRPPRSSPPSPGTAASSAAAEYASPRSTSKTFISPAPSLPPKSPVSGSREWYAQAPVYQGRHTSDAPR